MRLNTANRSFFTLAGITLVPYALLGLFGCGLLSVVAHRLATEGISGLHRPGEDLRPATVFFAVVTTGTVIAGLSVRRQVCATRRLAAFVAAHRASLPSELERTASHAGLAGRVDVLDDVHPCSFTYGLAAPRVLVSQGLIDAVTPDELRAVLEHERYHVQSWDTIKVVVARAAPSAFFFLPALAHLRDRYLAGRELAADRQAVRAVGQRPLAGALYRVLDGPTLADLGAAAALGGSEYLDQRVEQLEHGHEPALAPVPRPAIWLTGAGLLVLTIALALTLANGGGDTMAMGGSMSRGGQWGTAAAVLGGVVCSTGWVVIALAARRRGARHRQPA